MGGNQQNICDPHLKSSLKWSTEALSPRPASGGHIPSKNQTVVAQHGSARGGEAPAGYHPRGDDAAAAPAPSRDLSRRVASLLPAWRAAAIAADAGVPSFCRAFWFNYFEV